MQKMKNFQLCEHYRWQLISIYILRIHLWGGIQMGKQLQIGCFRGVHYQPSRWFIVYVSKADRN